MKQVRLTYARDIARNGGSDQVVMSDAQADMCVRNRRGVIVDDTPAVSAIPATPADIPPESSPAPAEEPALEPAQPEQVQDVTAAATEDAVPPGSEPLSAPADGSA